MFDLEESLEIVQKEPTKLEIGDILAEEIRVERTRDGVIQLGAIPGQIVSVGIRNALTDKKPNLRIVRGEGKSSKAPYDIFKFKKGVTPSFIRDFKPDVKLIEKINETAKRTREAGINIATQMDGRVADLIEAVVEKSDDLDLIAKKRTALNQYIKSPHLKAMIYKNFVGPAITNPAVIAYSEHNPEPFKRAVDLAVLATSIGSASREFTTDETGAQLIQNPLTKEQLFEMNIAAFLNNSGEDLLRARFQPGTEAFERLWPARDLELAGRILRYEDGETADGLSENIVSAVEHRATERGGRTWVTREDTKPVTIIYLNDEVRNGDRFDMNRDLDKQLTELQKLYLGLKDESPESVRIESVPLISEPLSLAKYWLDALNENASALNAVTLFKKIMSQRGSRAREDIIDGFEYVMKEKYQH